MTVVHHRGDLSIGEIYTRPIQDGYPQGSRMHIVEQVRDEHHQLPEPVFQALYLKAIALCALQPDHVVSYYRQDKEDEVPENSNNAPFRGHTKDIIYEGTIYHSDMSEIRKFDIKDITQKSRAVKRKERKEKRKGLNKGYR